MNRFCLSTVILIFAVTASAQPSSVDRTQASLALSELSLSSWLLMRGDPLTKRFNRLLKRGNALEARLKATRIEAEYAEPEARRRALEVSLATEGPQQQVEIARKQLARAEDMWTDAIKEQHIDMYKSRVAQITVVGPMHGAVNILKVPDAIANHPTVADAERDRLIDVATRDLNEAKQLLGDAVTKQGGHLEQVERFPSAGMAAARRTELELLSTARGVERQLAEHKSLLTKAARFEGRLKNLRGRAHAVMSEGPQLKRLLWWHIPRALAFLPTWSMVLRLMLYLNHKDPGYAPLAAYIQKQLSGEKTWLDETP